MGGCAGVQAVVRKSEAVRFGAWEKAESLGQTRRLGWREGDFAQDQRFVFYFVEDRQSERCPGLHEVAEGGGRGHAGVLAVVGQLRVSLQLALVGLLFQKLRGTLFNRVVHHLKLCFLFAQKTLAA